MEIRVCLRALPAGSGEGLAEVCDNGTVADLKDAVCALFGAEPAMQELTLEGEALADDTELDSLPLSPWSVVDVRETARQRAKYSLVRQEISGNAADLLAATKQGDTKLVSALIESGVDVDARGSGRYSARSALHCATAQGDIKMAAHLISLGAQLDLLDYFGETPLHNAAKTGLVPLTRLLMDAGAPLDIRNSCKQTALMLAVSRDHLPVASLLLASGCDHTILDSDGSLACHFAKSKAMYQLFPKKQVHA